MESSLDSSLKPSALLRLGGALPLESSSAGLMISRGQGRHIERKVPFFVLLFVREGTLYLEEAGQPFEVQAGQSLILWPNRTHRGTQDYAPDLQFYWLHFTLSEAVVTEATVEIPQRSTVTRPDFVTELFRHYLHDEETGRIQPLNAALYAWMILTEVADSRPPADARAATILAGRAFTHIRTHFHEKISASDVAQAIGCNPQYLSRVFQQVYHQSITHTIRRVRVNNAKSLMMHSNYNIAEVARLSGFEDVTYFQRVFKQLEDMTPLRYQRMYSRMRVNTS